MTTNSTSSPQIPLPSLTIVGAHAEGEIGDVIFGWKSPKPEPDFKNMQEKLKHYKAKEQGYTQALRELLIYEPRGKLPSALDLVVKEVEQADAGVIIIGPQIDPQMSGTNLICTVTALLETKYIQKPIGMDIPVSINTPLGVMHTRAEWDGTKCKSVTFQMDNAHVVERDVKIPVDGKDVWGDISFGGLRYAIVRPEYTPEGGLVARNGRKLVDMGMRYLEEFKAHDRLIDFLMFTEPVIKSYDGKILRARDAVVLTPGQLDRSPCGTGTSACMALLHETKVLKEGDTFIHVGISTPKDAATDEQMSHFECKIVAADNRAKTISVCVKGRAWRMGQTEHYLDSTDIFQHGFRVGGAWPPGKYFEVS